MLNPKFKQYAERMRELIEEATGLEPLARQYGYIPDYAGVHAWIGRAKNVIELTFGIKSRYATDLENLTKSKYGVNRRDVFQSMKGLLVGALDDLEKGFLVGQEFLIAGEIFDSVLEQAKELNKKGYKDPAAVLGRVVIEDALRRISRQENLDDTKKASDLNEQLRKANRYGKPQWRQIQAWLDIGNSAAHGDFNDYKEDEVKAMLEGIARFLAEELQIG